MGFKIRTVEKKKDNTKDIIISCYNLTVDDCLDIAESFIHVAGTSTTPELLKKNPEMLGKLLKISEDLNSAISELRGCQP